MPTFLLYQDRMQCAQRYGNIIRRNCRKPNIVRGSEEHLRLSISWRTAHKRGMAPSVLVGSLMRQEENRVPSGAPADESVWTPPPGDDIDKVIGTGGADMGAGSGLRSTGRLTWGMIAWGWYSQSVGTVGSL